MLPVRLNDTWGTTFLLCSWKWKYIFYCLDIWICNKANIWGISNLTMWRRNMYRENICSFKFIKVVMCADRYLTINVYSFLDKVYSILNFAQCGQHSAWCSWHGMHGAKIGLPIIHGCYGAECNQHGVADTAWGRNLDSFQF